MRVGQCSGPRRDPGRVARGGLPSGLRLPYTATPEYVVLLSNYSSFHFVVRPFAGFVMLCLAEEVGPTFGVQPTYGMLSGSSPDSPACSRPTSTSASPPGRSESARSVPPQSCQRHTPRRWSELPAGAC